MNIVKSTLLIYLLFFWVAVNPVFADFFENLSYTTSPEQYKKIKVKSVVSADKIVIESGEKIRLIGIRAPKAPKRINVERDKYGFSVEPKSPVIPIEEQAFTFAKTLLEGKDVRIEFDKRKKNSDLETIAYVFLIKGNIFVNAEILRQGYANLQLRPPNTKYKELLRKAYKEARREKRGLQGE